jgi:hypothetical protein
VKLQQINDDDVDGTQRLPDCPSFRLSASSLPMLRGESQSSPNLPEGTKHKPPVRSASTAGHLQVPNGSQTHLRTPPQTDDELEDIKLAVPAFLPNSDSQDSINTLSASNCKCASDSSYTLVYQCTLPSDIPQLWRVWQCLTAEGSVFLDYLAEVQKVTKLKFSPWSPPGDPAGELENVVPVEEMVGSQFAPALENIAAGYYRKSERLLPLNHGIPFLPKTAVGHEEFRILHVDGSRELCIANNALLLVLGVETNLKFCLKAINENETSLDVYANVNVTGKGKFNPPKGINLFKLGITERSTLEGIKSYYEQMEKYFRKKLPKPVPVGLECKCESLHGSNYRKIFSTTTDMRLPKLWYELQSTTAGSSLMHYMSKEAHWKGKLLQT